MLIFRVLQQCYKTQNQTIKKYNTFSVVQKLKKNHD